MDGVLTDGKLFFIPRETPRETPREIPREIPREGSQTSGSALELPASSPQMVEFKGFHAHDGVAISLARLGGIKTGLITKRVSETVALRARDLKLEYVCQGLQDKGIAFKNTVQQAGLSPDEAAFVGDDVIDLPAMRAAGFAIAVKNARAEVKKEAHYVTPHSGGDGAARDAVEFILKAQGKWKKVVDTCLEGKSGAHGN